MKTQIRSGFVPFLERPHWDNYRKKADGSESWTLIAHYSRDEGMGNREGALDDLRKLHKKLTGEGKPGLNLKQITLIDYLKDHQLIIKGEQNVKALITWAAEKENKTLIEMFVELKIPGTREAYDKNPYVYKRRQIKVPPQKDITPEPPAGTVAAESRDRHPGLFDGVIDTMLTHTAPDVIPASLLMQEAKGKKPERPPLFTDMVLSQATKPRRKASPKGPKERPLALSFPEPHEEQGRGR